MRMFPPGLALHNHTAGGLEPSILIARKGGTMLRALLLGPLLVPGLAAQVPSERPATRDEKQVVLEMSKARLHPRELARWLETQLGYFDGKQWNLPDRLPLRTE